MKKIIVGVLMMGAAHLAAADPIKIGCPWYVGCVKGTIQSCDKVFIDKVNTPFKGYRLLWGAFPKSYAPIFYFQHASILAHDGGMATCKYSTKIDNLNTFISISMIATQRVSPDTTIPGTHWQHLRDKSWECTATDRVFCPFK